MRGVKPASPGKTQTCFGLRPVKPEHCRASPGKTDACSGILTGILGEFPAHKKKTGRKPVHVTYWAKPTRCLPCPPDSAGRPPAAGRPGFGRFGRRIFPDQRHCGHKVTEKPALLCVWCRRLPRPNVRSWCVRPRWAFRVGGRAREAKRRAQRRSVERRDRFTQALCRTARAHGKPKKHDGCVSRTSRAHRAG